MKYILRVLALPFVLGIILIKALFMVFHECYLFISFGGELINYRDKNERKSIANIYSKLKENETI